MTILIYRPSLDVRSGAGQLMAMQARGLAAAGESVRLCCERGALKFFARTRRRAWHYSASAANARAAQGDLLVDHGLVLPAAHLVFVHNLFSEAVRYLPRATWAAAAQHEAAYFAQLDSETPIVANSNLVRRALLDRFDLSAARITVHHPGYDSDRFKASAVKELRPEARRSLRLAADAPLIGFVTSGDFEKRGLDGFLAAAERMLATRSDLRFLVVGSKRLPEAARRHRLIESGCVLYRPKSARPELWMAALDLFVYPACFEEFGMVILEAQALGIPVLTSRRVGATECLPSNYEPHLLDAPVPEQLADRALRLMANEGLRGELAAAAKEHAGRYGRDAYATQTIAAIQAQKARLK